MSEIHVADFSFKVVRKSSNFFRSIWNPIIERDNDNNVYRDYSKTKKYNYVNDFVRKCSNISTNLTSEQVVCIHEDNNAKAKENNNVQRIGYENPDRTEVHHVTSTIGSNGFLSTDYSDMTPTDELLEKLQIPPGERQNRLEVLKRQSEMFFRYLCVQIGTSTIVKIRRFIYNKLMYKHFSHSQVIGSKSEGLDMSGSDTDLLLNFDSIAYEKNDKHSFSTGDLEYDSQMDNVPPGYVLLKFTGRETSMSSNQFHESTHYLRNKFGYKESFTKERHGPATMVTICGEELDGVVSVKSESWPRVAREWIHRKRCFGWPSGKMINAIVQSGCHIVPVGCSSDHTNDKEWRLSFCIAEKELVKTFNHTQILVYGLLKIILKEVISCHKNIETLICSYFLKTVLFWAIEESRRSFWVPNNIVLCFHLCFRRLIQFVVNENCPNYFVVRNNMFEGRFTSHSKKELLGNLYKLLSSGWLWVLQSKSLYRFLYFVQGSKSQLELLKSMAIENEKVKSLNILTKLVSEGRLILSSALMGLDKTSKFKVNKFLKVPILRKKIVPMFCHFIDINQCNWNNKDLYTLYKFKINLFTMDLSDNVVTGKTLLATWLYNQGNYGDCLKITDVAVNNLDLRIIQNCDKSQHCHNFKQIMKCCRDISNLHYFCSFDIPFPVKSRMILKEIIQMFRPNAIPLFQEYRLAYIGFYPEIYVYFLRSLCFHRLGDQYNSDIEYRHMMSVDFVCSDNRKLGYRLSQFMMKLYLNVTRNDINMDLTNLSTVAFSVLPHLQKLDFTVSDFLILLKAYENIIKQGVHPDLASDLSGVPGHFWTNINDIMKYVSTIIVSQC
ncbi:Hypothetical predicted protein [Mytilus galloprovincialis]|uniref:Mab-21-like HhH/H2TH-like domain-containing protein n=1 Tax=Mytilus galloprovincialis TaxID=29158 RepID=A0A8B6CSW3_MYTGA|nr:Hypothetical predicted protein [Mytilus galloprovincialis]